MDKVDLSKIAARIVFALLLGTPVFQPGSAWATVAANALIVSTTTVEFDDGFAKRTVEASVSVIVNLVACPPILSSPADQTSDYDGPLSRHVYAYTLTACGNGPDAYDVVSNVVVQSNNAGDATTTASLATVDLGASVLSDGSTVSMLVVPSDGVADEQVNGIGVGDMVSIVGETRTVGAVSDSGTGKATITVTLALPSAPATGELVVETARIELEVSAGTVSTPGADVVVDAALDVTNSAGTSQDDVASTFGTGAGRMTKYVRNVTTAGANSGGGGARTFDVGGSTAEFYLDGVTGGTGDVLEYVLLVENTGSSAMTGSRIVDALPVPSAQFIPDAYGLGRDVAYVDPAGVRSFYTAADDQDPASMAGDTLAVNVGEQAGAGPDAGGRIPVDGEVSAAFQVRLR